ncbi:MAG: RNA 2',3'-cyclic phosphodiesterase [Phycisphaerales bacterium]|nr:RNA 2',3'-cyclic phosphodiesterase [Phycisphaerales bacterium]
MPRTPAELRLFVAVDPTPDLAAALLAEIDKCPEITDLRRVAAGQIHLTLQFIGETPARHLDEVAESCRRAAAGLEPFELRPIDLIRLPERGPARLVAARTDAPATLLELQRRLAHRLARSPRARAGDRFLPHLTLGRFRSPRPLPPLRRPLDLPPATITEIRLMRSVLAPTGAVHRLVEAVPLGKP